MIRLVGFLNGAWLILLAGFLFFIRQQTPAPYSSIVLISADRSSAVSNLYWSTIAQNRPVKLTHFTPESDMLLLAYQLYVTTQGQIIFVTVDSSPVRTIRSINLTGSQPQILAEDMLNRQSFVVSPDEQWIIYLTSVNGQPELARTDMQGKNQLILTHSDLHEINYRFTPDSRHIIFLTVDANNLVSVYVVDIDGSNLKFLGNHLTILNTYYEISPDSQWMIFQDYVEDKYDIFRLNLNSGAIEGLTQSPVYESSLQVSSDGQWLVFEAIGDTAEDIFLIPADGSSSPIDLGQNPQLDRFARFTPDGQWVIFGSQRNGKFDIYRVRLDGTGLENLSQNIRVPYISFGDFQISPDSQWLIAERDGEAISLLNLESRAIYTIDLEEIPIALETQSPLFSPSVSFEWRAWLVGLIGVGLMGLSTLRKQKRTA